MRIGRSIYWSVARSLPRPIFRGWPVNDKNPKIEFKKLSLFAYRIGIFLEIINVFNNLSFA